MANKEASADHLLTSISGWVYFIREGKSGPIKIGWTNMPGRRLSQLQTGNHRPLQFIGMVNGNYSAEADWHERFAGDRLAGEWFKNTPALMLAIREACPEQPRQVVKQAPRIRRDNPVLRAARVIPDPDEAAVRAAMLVATPLSPGAAA